MNWKMGGEHWLIFPTILTFVLFSLENGLLNYFRVEIQWQNDPGAVWKDKQDIDLLLFNPTWIFADPCQ